LGLSNLFPKKERGQPMNNEKRFAEVWDLETMFPGGSGSKAFADFLSLLQQDISGFGDRILEAEKASLSPEKLEALTEELGSLQARLIEAEAFASCLAAADQRDKKAVALGSLIRSLAAQF